MKNLFSVILNVKYPYSADQSTNEGANVRCDALETGSVWGRVFYMTTKKHSSAYEMIHEQLCFEYQCSFGELYSNFESNNNSIDRLNMKINIPVLLIAFFQLIVLSCQPVFYTDKFYVVAQINENFNSKPDVLSESGNGYARSDSAHIYSQGLEWILPDTLIAKDLRVVFEADMRTGTSHSGHSFIMSIQTADTILQWNGFKVNDYILGDEKWDHLIDSIDLTTAIAKNRKTAIRFFAMKNNSPSYVEMDNLHIVIKRICKAPL